MKPDVTPTAEIIDTMANTMRYYADEMDRIAARMRQNDDLDYAADAMTAVSNMHTNLRLDLLVVRPMRAIRRGYGDAG